MTDINMNEEFVDEFFRDARERHAIYLRRMAGQAKPWTSDPIMQKFSITNVFRELDKTTVHLRTNIRDPLRDHPLVLPAVALYRWFTLMRTGDTIFNQPSFLTTAASPLGGASARPEATLAARFKPSPTLPAGFAAGAWEAPATPWQRWLETEDVRELEWALRKQGSPWCTGSFMIRSPIGMDKLEGVLSSFRDFWHGRPKINTKNGYVSMNWTQVAEYAAAERDGQTPLSMKSLHEWLTQFYGLGGFLANEVTSDLRYTFLLDKAPDVGTFNFPGPGAMRGAYLMLHGVKQGRKDRLEKSTVREVEAVATELLARSRDPKYWPQPHKGIGEVIYDPSYLEQLKDVLSMPARPEDWPAWGGREPGMWLCEFVKLKRTRLGIGRPRGNYA